MTDVTLVTGATGFIGGYVVRRLVSRGTKVRVLVRNQTRLPAGLRSALEIVVGDVRDPGALAEAVPGTKTVLHLAACAKAWSKDPDEFSDVNVGAVKALLEVVADQGVERLVHVSTILTLPPHRPAPINGRSFRLTPYESTKLAGEHLVEDYAARGRHAVIVHPTRVYGPGPLNDANGVTKAISLYLRGLLRVRLGDGDALGNYVHADDVAQGIIRAARYGRAGEHYVLGGENASFRELLETVSELTGVRRRVVPLPPHLALAVAGAGELWGRMGGQAPITPSWVRALLEDRRVTFENAREDLGYDPRSLAAGLASTIRWLVSDQVVKSCPA